MTLSRREFLQASAGTAGLLALQPHLALAGSRSAKRCILLMLVGGPSQLETWDPKPNAPAEIRGPFGVTQTALPGVYFSEHLPRLAQRADRLAVIRTVHHHEAPIHETGLQLLQTGALARNGIETPHLAALAGRFHGTSPAWAILPEALESTGVSHNQGQGASYLGKEFAPALLPASLAEDTRYGKSPLGRACLQARQLVESGMECVTINMFSALYDRVTWDCHADGFCLNSTLYDYRRTLCPSLDQALSALLDDLQDRGLLESTVVAALGEMGRTPTLNDRGGRDHWTGAWSVLLAGGGVQGGRVIGTTDAHAGEAIDRPVHASEIAATLLHTLGVDSQAQLPGPHGQLMPLCSARPVLELF